MALVGGPVKPSRVKTGTLIRGIYDDDTVLWVGCLLIWFLNEGPNGFIRQRLQGFFIRKSIHWSDKGGLKARRYTGHYQSTPDDDSLGANSANFWSQAILGHALSTTWLVGRRPESPAN